MADALRDENIVSTDNFTGGKDLTNGVLAGLLQRVPVGAEFTNATRPDPTTVLVGTMIFNTDDNAPNWGDGAEWRDAAGNIT